MYIQVCTLKSPWQRPIHCAMNTPITDVCLIQRPACFTVTTEGLTQRLVTPPPPLTSFPSKIGDPYSPSHRLRHLQSLFIVQSMQHLRSVPPPFSLPVNSGRSSSSWSIRF